MIQTHIYEPLNDEVIAELATKADKDTDAVAGNLFQAVAGGGYEDSGVATDSVATKLLTHVTQAATDTLTAAEVSGTVISNYGQAAENTQTLPAAASGYNFIAQIGTAGAGAFHIKAGASDYIILDGTALDDADKVSCATPAVGDYITFWTIQTGADEWQWMAASGNGTWTDGGA